MIGGERRFIDSRSVAAELGTRLPYIAYMRQWNALLLLMISSRSFFAVPRCRSVDDILHSPTQFCHYTSVSSVQQVELARSPNLPT